MVLSYCALHPVRSYCRIKQSTGLCTELAVHLYLLSALIGVSVTRMELVLEVLDDLGYASLQAKDGASALKILKSNTRIDLLITDVGLPGGMNGRQLADAALSLRTDLMVLFITGYAENAVINHGHLEPGMEIMTKPFQMEALGRKIRALIESKS